MAPILHPEEHQTLETIIRREWPQWKQACNMLRAAEAAKEHLDPCIYRADLSGGEKCPCHQLRTYTFPGWTAERTSSYKEAIGYEGTNEELKEAIVQAHREIYQTLEAEDAANAASTQMPGRAP